MADITLVTGGIKCGKTAYALELCKQFSEKTYIATAAVIDDEMKGKVEAHKAERDESWSTFEEQTDTFDVINKINNGVILYDCLTTWVSNLMYHNLDIKEYFDKLEQSLLASEVSVVIVSNEVGFGVIGADIETRRYVNLLGELNNRIGKISKRVVLMAAGIPIVIKGDKR